MPSLPLEVAGVADRGAQGIVEIGGVITSELVKRINVPINASTPPDQILEMKQDPWSSSGKYGLGWIYFGIILILCTTFLRMYHYWGDKIRTALYKEEVINSALEAPPYYDLAALPTSKTYNSTAQFFPTAQPQRTDHHGKGALILSARPINNAIAFLRFIFYRPIPTLKIWKWKFSFPSLGVVVIVTAGFLFSMLYCFLPRPLFFSTMSSGSPPLAIRAGMLSVALLPWIVALASKVNLISYMTGICTERLIVLHRWAAYICVVLALIHAVPFWLQSARDPVGFGYFKQYFNQQYYIFTTGVAALVPLLFLFVHSLPVLRHKAHELFALLHIPVSWAFIVLMFWHCHNYLTSWAYLYTTIVFLVFSLVGRLFYLNWSNPTRPSFLIGEESSVTILPENAIKITIPTRTRWKPGQYAYIRMPGIRVLDNHPFTIASLCSEDFPSHYGEEYRDMTLVFRPFGGFTRKVLDMAMQKGQDKTYRAFVEGPYGGMQRQMSAFDEVIFFAGGSGITAIASQLLDLIKRMRDGKATTTRVHVVWAMKRPEIMAWFKEELRICRECAPPESVHCNFYITSAKRYQALVNQSDMQINRLSGRFNERYNEVVKAFSAKRDSQLYEDFDKKEDGMGDITALPSMHLAPPKFTSSPVPYFPPPPSATSDKNTKSKQVVRPTGVSTLSSVYAESGELVDVQLQSPQPILTKDPFSPQDMSVQSFDFGFEKDGYPDEKAPRSAIVKSPLGFKRKPNLSIFTGDSPNPMPAYSSPDFRSQVDPYRPRDGWRTEYGRPDIPGILRALSKDFGRRTCVFVCGPPEMRIDVARTVAALQSTVWHYPDREELFLHTENYSI